MFNEHMIMHVLFLFVSGKLENFGVELCVLTISKIFEHTFDWFHDVPGVCLTSFWKTTLISMDHVFQQCERQLCRSCRTSASEQERRSRNIADLSPRPRDYVSGMLRSLSVHACGKTCACAQSLSWGCYEWQRNSSSSYLLSRCQWSGSELCILARYYLLTRCQWSGSCCRRPSSPSSPLPVVSLLLLHAGASLLEMLIVGVGQKRHR
jgi:hypothetical protein